MQKIIVVGIFDNSNTKKDGTSTVRFRFPFSEIANWIRIEPEIGKQVRCVIRFADSDEKINLGYVQIKTIQIDREGECKLTVEGETNTMEIAKLQLTFEKTFKVIFGIEGDEN